MGSIQKALTPAPALISLRQKMDLSSSAVPPDEEDSTLTTIQYTTLDRLFHEVDRAIGDSLVVKLVSPEIFAKLKQEREKRGRSFRFNLYDRNSQCLIITKPTRPHERLHGLLYEECRDEILRMGRKSSWMSMFATDFSKGGSSGSEGSSGEGDSAGGPIPERDGQAFPTLVIEAGYSQSLPSLRQKAHWWFDISNHDVKIVILAKLHLRQREITLERWEERQRGARAGATTTRHASAWVASCHQTITITESSANPQEYRVASVSYADAAAKGARQTPEEAAAPQQPEIIPNESASTASLIDVDLPSVHTVNSDFLEQDIQTETQAERIRRDEEAARANRAAKKKAPPKGRKADSWVTRQFSQLSDGSVTAIALVNIAGVVGVSGFLGYRAWGLYEKSRLDWKHAGIGFGVLAAVGAVEAVLGRYMYKSKGNGSS